MMKSKERFYKGYGAKVALRFLSKSPFKGKKETLHNVTEIHEGYRPGKVAFESDIHSSGLTHDINHVSWMVSKEKKLWRRF